MQGRLGLRMGCDVNAVVRQTLTKDRTSTTGLPLTYDLFMDSDCKDTINLTAVPAYVCNCRRRAGRVLRNMTSWDFMILFQMVVDVERVFRHC